MSAQRQVRLAAFLLAAAGTITTAVQLSGIFDFGEGSLWLPVAAVLGIVTLIAKRPRTTK